MSIIILWALILVSGLMYMKAYVSIDLEGLPGISSISQVGPRYSLYDDARRIMTWITNTVSRQLLKEGFSHVTVADSHGYMANIAYMDVVENVELIQGYPRPYSMMIGVEEGYDAVLMIGYHARAGTLKGFLDHTYSSTTIHRIYVNNELASEYYLNALYAGYYDVPVIMVAGDEYLREEVEKHTPWAVFIALKKGYSRLSAKYSSTRIVEKKLSEGVREAVKVLKKGEARPLKPNGTLKLRIELKNQVYADMAQLVPGTRRVDAYTIEYEAKNPVEALGVVEVVAWLGIAGYTMIERQR